MDIDQEIVLAELCTIAGRPDLLPLLIFLEVEPEKAKNALIKFVQFVEPHNVASADQD